MVYGIPHQEVVVVETSGAGDVVVVTGGIDVVVVGSGGTVVVETVVVGARGRKTLTLAVLR
jgi:hypothetical protein